ncbi:MAG TPA: hypothetical protein VFC73_00065 [Syntrophomonadaceae bacterium]|nr:hypothetical protein [Syntrophomonadaceae bacterium]
MRYRRIIYLAIVAFLIIYLFNYNDSSSLEDISLQPENIEIAALIDDFKDLSDNDELPLEVITADYPRNLYIPHDFTGQSGELFYLSIDNSIYKYKIELLEDNDKASFVYILKDVFENITLPESKFKKHAIK